MKSSSGNKRHVLLRYSDARSIDALTIEQGNDETLLMGLAAAGALHHLKQDYLAQFWAIKGLQLIILCGSGNNGGDGLALASLLCADPDRRSGDDDINERMRIYALPAKTAAAKFYQAKLQRQGVRIRPLQDFPQDAAELICIEGLTIVEALLGTGQSRPPSGDIASALQAIGRMQTISRAALVALDVPAGLTESEGLAQHAPVPDCVYTFGFEKAVTSLIPGLRIRRIACGFEAQIEAAVLSRSTPVYRSESTSPEPFFQRDMADHKYSAGHAWMVAGEYDMEGAALLSLQAFLRSGGGYVRLFHPAPESRLRYLSVLPSVIYHAASDFVKACEEDRPPRSILIGPGMHPETIAALRESLIKGLTILNQRRPLTVILDAAACSLAFDERFPELRCLITPHTGEWNALGGPSVRCVDDLEPARVFSGGIYTYLKGPVSFLFGPDGIDVYNAPLPSLAVAGSGDLFAGLLLRAACGHLADRPIPEIVSACVALQHRSAGMHPEQQLKVLQELLS
jgi:NAD(P)H-hydrate epimerase